MGRQRAAGIALVRGHDSRTGGPELRSCQFYDTHGRPELKHLNRQWRRSRHEREHRFGPGSAADDMRQQVGRFVTPDRKSGSWKQEVRVEKEAEERAALRNHAPVA